MTIKNLSEKLALELVAEKKFHELIPGASPDDHFESTGIASKGNNFLVVFSDTPHFARIDKSLTTGHGSNCLFRNMGKTTGYQDVTYDGRGQRFLALTEATKQGDSSNLPRINQFNTDLGYIEGRFIDYDVKGNDRILRASPLSGALTNFLSWPSVKITIAGEGRKGKRPAVARSMSFSLRPACGAAKRVYGYRKIYLLEISSAWRYAVIAWLSFHRPARPSGSVRSRIADGVSSTTASSTICP